MKYCNSCKVSINSPVLRCPLCYSSLKSADNALEPQSYPYLAEKAARYNLIFRILLFLSLAAAGVSLTVNFSIAGHVSWSLIVVVNILYMWVSIGTAINRRKGLGFNIFLQVISLSGFCVAMDFFTGHIGNNWALNYVVPFLFISAMISITIIIIVKRVALGEFILYFVLTALLGFLPLVFLAAGLVNVRWPSITSAAWAGLSLISIFIFADNATKIELKKRFHI